MCALWYVVAATVLVTGAVRCEDTCLLPWEEVLEEWATSDTTGNITRHGRIMSLPPTKGYYVSERIDLMPPPPPPHSHYPHHTMHHRGPYPAAPNHHHSSHHPPGPPGSHPPKGPPPGSPGSYYHPGPPSSASQRPPGPPPENPPPPSPSSTLQYDEWQATPPPAPAAGKIVNRPNNPYKDQFKPSYPPPSPPIPVDRVDEVPPPAPQKQVSETDVYLLRAIEKLVYRVDLMEKRLRKMEETMHYMVAGSEPKPEPCLSNFTRIGGGCYHVSSESANWKGASYACRRIKGYLLELDGDERDSFIKGLQTDDNLKGSTFWTGGLNPGLLWIWSHSAKPVADNSTSSAAIEGEGRCLALTAARDRGHHYRGEDCALKHRYVCEKREDKEKLGNEIERVARKLRTGRKPKIMWRDDDTT